VPACGRVSSDASTASLPPSARCHLSNSSLQLLLFQSLRLPKLQPPPSQLLLKKLLHPRPQRERHAPPRLQTTSSARTPKQQSTRQLLLSPTRDPSTQSFAQRNAPVKRCPVRTRKMLHLTSPRSASVPLFRKHLSPPASQPRPPEPPAPLLARRSHLLPPSSPPRTTTLGRSQPRAPPPVRARGTDGKTASFWRSIPTGRIDMTGVLAFYFCLSSDGLLSPTLQSGLRSP
jgi:hypothetical protein